MKTFKLLSLLLIFASLLAGCSKDDELLDQNDDLTLKNATLGQVFKVMPSGGDDTQALQDAFDDAIAAGHGSVVQLCEGEYHLGFIEIHDFYGTLKGAGKGKTIITVMNNLNLDTKISIGVFPALMKFVGGNVTICHFTIRTPPGRVSVGGPGYGHVTALVNFTASNSNYEPLNENRSVNAVVHHVCFKGQKLDEGGIGYVYGYNAYFALWVCADYLGMPDNTVPRQKIDLMVLNSEFDNFCYGIVIQDIKNSRVVIGEKNSGNMFSNVDRAGGIWEGRDNEVILAGNTFNIPAFSWAFAADDYPYYPYLKDEAPTKKTLVNVHDNVFNLDHADVGLYFQNILSYYWGHIPMAIQVKNNQFNMTDGYEWAIGSLYTDGLVIRNNKFGGHGDLALWLVDFSRNGLVLGNNFSTANLETGVAYLAPNAKDWSFVGGDFSDKVIDLGENNVFTGMNVTTADEPLGRSISAKLAPMNHLMH